MPRHNPAAATFGRYHYQKHALQVTAGPRRGELIPDECLPTPKRHRPLPRYWSPRPYVTITGDLVRFQSAINRARANLADFARQEAATNRPKWSLEVTDDNPTDNTVTITARETARRTATTHTSGDAIDLRAVTFDKLPRPHDPDAVHAMRAALAAYLNRNPHTPTWCTDCQLMECAECSELWPCTAAEDTP